VTGKMMNKDLMPMVADIVSARTSHKSMTGEELTESIRLVYTTLSGLSAQDVTISADVVKLSAPDKEPAVAIEKSIFADYIICLEDGKKLKTLKRHLKASYGLSPEQYRARWNLSGTYPMTAPNYAARRAEVARAIGLGRKLGSATRVSVPVKRVKEGVSGKRGRPRKTAA
jgi:predicted transcriptional regulator